MDSPAGLVYYHLHSYLRGNLAMVDFDFNLMKQTNKTALTKKMNQLCDSLERGELKG